MPSDRRHTASPERLAQFVLAIGATVVALLLVELFYRARLLVKLSDPQTQAFTALDRPLTEFDREFGYRYVPGRQAITCRIQAGRVRSFNEVHIDTAGNLATDTPPARDSIDVLIVGDSFTANPNQPLGWPHHYAAQTGHRIHNYARDGYGVLQMAHLAAAKSRELNPDLVILAIIVEDVTRPRTWRSTVTIDGHPTAVLSTHPDSLGNPKLAMPTALIDPALTADWCRRQMTTPDPKDPVLTRLNQRYRSLALNHQRAYLLSPTHSLLRDRLQHHDPWRGLRTPTAIAMAPSPLTSFEEDADFVRDIRSIEAPLHVVVLPKHDELVGRKVLGTEEMLGLLQSLERVTGKEPTVLLDTVLGMKPDIGRMYLLPDDQHPSAYGGEVLGRGVAGVVGNEDSSPDRN